MKHEYKVTRLRATGLGLFSPTPTQDNIECAVRENTVEGWRLIQVLITGLLYRKTWLVLERPIND